MTKSWRDKARPIIAKVLHQTEGMDEKAIKKALYDAYPFGERAMHPYRIWCSEIAIQRGKRRLGVKKEKPNPDQKKLFPQ